MPTDWERTEIGIKFELFAGGDLDNESYSPIKTNYYNYPIYSNAIQNDGIYGYTSKPKYKGNSITITGRGLIGIAMYRYEDFDAIVRLLVLTPKPDSGVNSRYVTYLINECISFPKESTGVPQLTVPQIRYIELILPKISEQNIMADALSDMDNYIASLGKLIAKKKAIKRGAMQELLTGKRRLPGFDGDWVSINLAQKSILKARIGWQGLTTAEYRDEGYAYLITGTDFKNGRINWNGCHYVEKFRYEQDTNIQVKNGDVLITKDGTIGKVALVEGLEKKATLNSGVFVIRPINGAYNNLFVYFVLSSEIFTNFLTRLSAGSTINHLYQKDFVGFEFNAPSTIEEQQAIAEVLIEIDNEIKALTAKQNKAKLIKQGMMQELLTGRIRML